MTITNIAKLEVPKEIEQKILTAIELKKELDKYEKEIKESLKKAMIDHDVYSIKNDEYSVTLATRKSYKADGDIPKGFSKRVLDTDKVKIYTAIHGRVPEGVVESDTKYITWRAK